MNITLRIDRKGEQPGTLGWLCKNAASIRVGLTKSGKNRGAWLKDHEGGTICPLAIRGYYDWMDGRDQTATADRYEDPCNLPAGRDFTDAAWAVIEELTERAVELLEEPVGSKSVEITLETGE